MHTKAEARGASKKTGSQPGKKKPVTDPKAKRASPVQKKRKT